MISTENKSRKAINTKTGNIGTVIDEYERTTDSKKMVTVKTLSGQKAHWNAKHVQNEDWPW